MNNIGEIIKEEEEEDKTYTIIDKSIKSFIFDLIYCMIKKIMNQKIIF